MKVKKIKEKDIQKAILNYLLLKGYFAKKLSTVGIFVKKTGFYIPSPNKGMADIICIKDPVCHTCGGYWIYWIEIKAQYGKQSPDQIAFQKEVEGHGHKYILAHSLAEVMEEGL